MDIHVATRAPLAPADLRNPASSVASMALAMNAPCVLVLLNHRTRVTDSRHMETR